MKIYLKEDYIREKEDVFGLISNEFIKDSAQSLSKPQFGEIWICQIPILIYDNEKVLFQTLSRPVLVIDDGHEYFVKNDNKNYYVLKITSQKDTYHRLKIKNHKDFGLCRESYIRLEVPLKVEKEQFLYKIGTFSNEDAKKILGKVQSFLQKRINSG